MSPFCKPVNSIFLFAHLSIAQPISIQPLPVLSMSDGTDEQDVDFPQPKRPVFRVLFNYIHKHLWPHWTDAERLEFADHTSKLITLNKTIVSLQTSICQPSVGHILEKPYSIVKVTTGMAIWGVDRLNICPGMTAFLGKHACRLVAFPDTPAPGFGQPPKSLARSSAACVPEQVKHDDDIDELAEGSIRGAPTPLERISVKR